MVRIALLPQDDRCNGWLKILPPRADRPALSGSRRADWLVIGAGFAGLAAARRLAEQRPGEEIALLEAQAAGEGTSGRNSGFAIDVPHNVGASLAELEGAQRFLRLSRAGIDYLEKTVRAAGIACQWNRRGKYHAAVSQRGVREILEPYVRTLEALGEPFHWLDRRALAADLGTDYYEAAVHTPGGILMNPVALVRGLADSLPSNVSLYERTPVVEIDYGKVVTATTPRGSVSAPRLILATNGFATQFGAFTQRLLVFAAYASLTRRLTPAERTALGGVEDWGLTPANGFAGVTMRLTQDHRILVRQRIVFSPGARVGEAERAATRRRHLAAFRARFPQLPEVTLEHTWTGFVCLSRNHAPGFGPVRPGVWAAVCQNAIGVAKGTASGLLAADLALGEDNPLLADMLSLGTPTALPPRPFLDLGVRAHLAWELWRHRAER